MVPTKVAMTRVVGRHVTNIVTLSKIATAKPERCMLNEARGLGSGARLI